MPSTTAFTPLLSRPGALPSPSPPFTAAEDRGCARGRVGVAASAGAAGVVLAPVRRGSWNESFRYPIPLWRVSSVPRCSRPAAPHAVDDPCDPVAAQAAAARATVASPRGPPLTADRIGPCWLPSSRAAQKVAVGRLGRPGERGSVTPRQQKTWLKRFWWVPADTLHLVHIPHRHPHKIKLDSTR